MAHKIDDSELIWNRTFFTSWFVPSKHSLTNAFPFSLVLLHSVLT